MQISGIVFDFNGTLFFDTPYHVEAWDRISMELTGEHVTRERMETEFSGMPNFGTLKKMTGGKLSDKECEAYSRKKEEMYRLAVSETPGGAQLAPGAADFFDYLKEHGIPFTIASSSIIENIEFFVETFHLDRWINPSDIVYDDGTYKDKVQMFRDAAERIHVKDHLLIFEDSLSGIKAASCTDARIIVIRSAQLEAYYPEYPRICAVIDDFRGILPELQKIH